jgi:alcohol dehydrogenase YqhD (iron-dependent ADH family)
MTLSRLSLAQEGIDLCRKEGVDFILAVGGGSVIDSSKCIAYGVPYEGNVNSSPHWDSSVLRTSILR